MVTAANPYRDQRTQYDPGMGMDELCDALNLGLYIGVTAPSGAAPTISSAIISFLQSGSGAQSETIQAALRRLPHSAQYDTTANFNAAIGSLTGTFGFASMYFKEGAALNWLPGASEPDMYLGANTANSGITNAVDSGAVLFSLLSNDTNASADFKIGSLRFEKNLSGGGYNGAFIHGYQDQVSGGDASAYIDFETRWLGAGSTDTKVRLGENPYSLEVRGILRVTSHSPSSTAGTIVLDGGQITFPATQSPSAGANVLDDYEEGTFTPTVLSGGAATGRTYATQDGDYQKVGKWVQGTIDVALSAKGSSTGATTIGGLPFANSSGANVSVLVVPANTTFTFPVQGYIANGGSVINLVEPTSGGGLSSIQDTALSATSEFIIHFSYPTSG